MLPVTPKTWTSTTWPWATAFWTAVSAWTPTLSCCSRGVRRGRGTGPERGARTDDHLAAAKALWAQRPTDFDGPFTTLRAARLGVPPVTPGGPPVWVGGHSDAALLRALRFGDGWYGTGVTAAEISGVGRRLRELDRGTGNVERLTLASAVFLTPPGIAGAVPA
ncbi:MAG: LLM class flavin-dependent oxidoreductase, partial [Streptosporangiaceae bacterium]